MRRIIIALVIGLIVMAAIPKTHTNNELKGERKIIWHDVNIRKGYSTNSKVIKQLYCGEIVRATGREHEVFGGIGAPDECWIQIEIDGGFAWVVAAATVSIG